MIESAVCILLVIEKLVDLVYIFPYFWQVQRAEIFEKPFVVKILNFTFGTLSMLKKKAFGIYLGGVRSAR